MPGSTTTVSWTPGLMVDPSSCWVSFFVVGSWIDVWECSFSTWFSPSRSDWASAGWWLSSFSVWSSPSFSSWYCWKSVDSTPAWRSSCVSTKPSRSSCWVSSWTSLPWSRFSAGSLSRPPFCGSSSAGWLWLSWSRSLTFCSKMSPRLVTSASSDSPCSYSSSHVCRSEMPLPSFAALSNPASSEERWGLVLRLR